MTRRALSLFGLSMLALTACVGAPEPGDEGAEEVDVQPIKAAHATMDNVGLMTQRELLTPTDLNADGLVLSVAPDNQAPSGPVSVVQAGIQYHNGPVMTSPIHLYLVWYGTQWTAGAKTIITDFASGLGRSSWWTGIQPTYTNGSNTPVSTNVTLAGQYTYPSPQTSLSDSGVFTVVKNSIGASPKLPNDANGIYLVLTSAEVNETSGFCTQYCGWHTHGTYSTTDIKYSFVGNPSRCLSACAAQDWSPNGDAGADGLVAIFAHEVAEAASDPDLNAWYDASGYENADKCAWTFGATSTAANGAEFNMMIGGRQFLVQRNWKNSGSGSCAMQ